MAEVALVTVAVVLAVFGAVFAALGMRSERAYWSQRDPTGDPAAEATSFGTLVRQAFPIAVSDRRAPLRVAAIGVVLLWIALACGLAALVVWLV